MYEPIPTIPEATTRGLGQQGVQSRLVCTRSICLYVGSTTTVFETRDRSVPESPGCLWEQVREEWLVGSGQSSHISAAKLPRPSGSAWACASPHLSGLPQTTQRWRTPLGPVHFVLEVAPSVSTATSATMWRNTSSRVVCARPQSLMCSLSLLPSISEKMELICTPSLGTW